MYDEMICAIRLYCSIFVFNSAGISIEFAIRYLLTSRVMEDERLFICLFTREFKSFYCPKKKSSVDFKVDDYYFIAAPKHKAISGS